MKVLILYSGGLDSLIMAKYAEVYYPNAEVIKVWYDLGQEYARKEEAVLPPDVIKHKLDWLDATATPQGKDGSASGNIYIPGRNLVLAVNAACKYLPDQVWMGALLGETHSKATDKNWRFLKEGSNLLSYVLSPFLGSGVRLAFPLAESGLNKLTSVQWFLANGGDVQDILKSSSCLSGEDGNCGRCVVCFRRWGIFKQLGIEGEVYNVDPLTVKDNVDMVREMMYGDHYDEHRTSEILPALDERWILENDLLEAR